MTSRQKSLASGTLMLLATAVFAVGCSTDGPEVDEPPVDQGTVVPPVDIGVGGGAPVDNLDEDVNEGGIGNPQSDRDNNQPSQQDG